MTEIIFVVQESPEGGYEARAASESIFTEADTLEELREMVRDAVSCHFESEDRPRPSTQSLQPPSFATASRNRSRARSM